MIAALDRLPLWAVVPLAIALGGCGSSPRLAPSPAAFEVEPPAAEAAGHPHDSVWTARAEVALYDGVSRSLAIERVFTRLEVLGPDSVGLRLRCEVCLEPFEGYVAAADIVVDYVPPEVAAWGELAEFALSIRTAAARHDVQALRPVMSPDFSFSFVGIQSADAAIAVWEGEQFGTLGRVPELLDRGLASRDGMIWSAPPEFTDQVGYRGLRIGFRRGPDGRWEWLYLIRGIEDR